MYAYARNNPLVFTDPTGQYVCRGTADQCKRLKAALAEARKAMENHNKKSKEYKALSRVLKFYGKENTPNGVVATFGSVPGTAAATASTTTNRIYGSGGMTLSQVTVTTIKFDLTKTATSSVENFAEVAVHEGQHRIDQLSGNNPNTRAGVKNLERIAYRVQSYLPEGMARPSTWGVWNPVDWAPDRFDANRDAAIERNAEQSAQWWCQQYGPC